jgi:PTS system nitrogen regulatory IIA component
MKITTKDVARLLSVPEEIVFGWVRAGEIPVTRVHEQYRFNRAEILEWATARGISVSADLFPTHDAEESGAPRLSDALEIGGVHPDVGGADRDAVLRAVVDRLALPDDADREVLLDMLLAEDALGSTAVGEGIAIPHVRHPVVLGVRRPSVALLYLATPLDLRTPDGRPVDTIFFMIAPTVRAHLQLLARLAGALHDPELKQAIARRAGRDEILAAVRRAEEKG